jgi:MFS family permease
MFPQLGAPVGFLSSTGVFLFLSHRLSDTQFLEWGWRVPFLASALLVVIGLYVRLRLTETAEFRRVIESGERARVPMLTVCKVLPRTLVLASFVAAAPFVLFYLLTVFSLSWGARLGYARPQILEFQMLGMVFFGLMIPVSAALCDKWGTRLTLTVAMLGLIAFGLCADLFLGSRSSVGTALFTVVGFGLTGLGYGPLGTALAELFPTPVRYTGISLAYNFAGILGASLTPYIATWLATNYGLAYVGAYSSGFTLLCLAALWLINPGKPAASLHTCCGAG